MCSCIIKILRLKLGGISVMEQCDVCICVCVGGERGGGGGEGGRLMCTRI